jgi:pimeloyl-ACP methyl ester carboxylesterase
MPFCALDALRLHYILLKPQSAAVELSDPLSTPPRSPLKIVLLHGLFVGNLAAWYLSVGRELSKKHEVLMYDLRGHGKSGRPAEGYDVKTQVNDLRALLEGVGWSESALSIVGHSYGGVIGLEHALLYPQSVHSLALIDVPLASDDPEEPDAMSFASPEDLLNRLPLPLQETLKGGGRRARKRLESWFALSAQTTLLSDLQSTPPLIEERLQQIRCPTLALYGTRSPCDASARRIKRAIPHAHLCWVEGAGHFLLNEAPRDVERALTHFFDDQLYDRA